MGTPLSYPPRQFGIRFMRIRSVCLSGAAAFALGIATWPAAAQGMAADGGNGAAVEAPEDSEGDLSEGADDENVIVITAGAVRGTVVSDIPPQLELTEETIASYGASSIEDLLAALGPQTGSARGRGGGRPVILLNGQRIGSFRELRDLPPEAIERVQIFPEELALQYGYRPDQRVVNFILKDNFNQLSAELEYGQPMAGGYRTGEVQATMTRIDNGNRLNIDLEYQPATRLTEAERGIVRDDGDSLGLVDETDFRTLQPSSDTFEANASWNSQIGGGTGLTLSGEYSHAETEALQGLAGANFTIPGSSPYSRTGEDEALRRLFPGAGVLRRDSSTDAAQAGAALNGDFSGWQWSLTGNYTLTEQTVFTDRQGDTEALVAAIEAGDPNVDPFAPDLGSGTAFVTDRAESTSQTADAVATIAGSPIDLPAGPVSLSLSTAFDWQDLESRTLRGGAAIASSDLSRSRGNVRANADLPITSVREGVLDAIGSLSVNLTAGYSELSDFGGLTEYGYGLRWEPVEDLVFLASVIGEEAAPTVAQLGDAVIVTPNVATFDIATGDTVFIDQITGGNPDLLAESRRDLKLSLNWSPGGSREQQLTFEYVKNRSEDVSSAFPVLTPAIEAAFPGRVVRGADGDLLSIDARPVTFSEVEAERLRYGFSLRGEFGQDDEDEGGRRGGRGGGGPPFGRGPDGGRWNLSVFHDWSLDETVLIRPGVDRLDLLDGDVTGSGAPISRHTVEMEGGVFLDGFGLRANANYTGKARVDGSDITGSSDLYFGDLFTLDLRLFADLDSQQGLIEAVPFLKGSRLSLDVENVFGGIRRVENGAGEVPLAYQPGYVDPVGRFVGIEFRKTF